MPKRVETWVILRGPSIVQCLGSQTTHQLMGAVKRNAPRQSSARNVPTAIPAGVAAAAHAVAHILPYLVSGAAVEIFLQHVGCFVASRGAAINKHSK